MCVAVLEYILSSIYVCVCVCCSTGVHIVHICMCACVCVLIWSLLFCEHNGQTEQVSGDYLSLVTPYMTHICVHTHTHTHNFQEGSMKEFFPSNVTLTVQGPKCAKWACTVVRNGGSQMVTKKLLGPTWDI